MTVSKVFYYLRSLDFSSCNVKVYLKTVLATTMNVTIPPSAAILAITSISIIIMIVNTLISTQIIWINYPILIYSNY